MASSTALQLGRYLLCHHADQQELPLDCGSIQRRMRRRSSGSEHQRGLCAASPEALLAAMQELADEGCVKVEQLAAGPKTLTMLTWVGAGPLARLLGTTAAEEGLAEAPAPGQEAPVRKRLRAGGPKGSDGSMMRTPEESPHPPFPLPLRVGTSSRPHGDDKATLAEILGKPTALEALAAERFKKHAPVVREFCPHRTKAECETAAAMRSAGPRPQPEQPQQQQPPLPACAKLHFRRVIESHTDVTLGDCAYLSSCRRTRTCKYVHYEIEEETGTGLAAAAGGPTSADVPPVTPRAAGAPAVPPVPIPAAPGPAATTTSTSTTTTAAAAGATTTAYELLQSGPYGEPPPPPPPSPPQSHVQQRIPAQWVHTDVREFDLTVLGQFPVIMADPPWEIHMDLPYGTMADDEVGRLNFPKLQEQDGGLLFLWVTGRAMERARELLDYWGYRQVEEIVWIKTNQLQKVIRTGRTGHWLNHSKEHCLVGVKGQPRGLNRYLDCDVIVAEARETSRKPDEIYDLIERLSPGTRKIEIFGRRHNIRDGWVTVGNQLPPTRLVEPDVVARFDAWQAQQRQQQQQRWRP